MLFKEFITEAHKDFDYSHLAKDAWREILHDAQEHFHVSFDTENDDKVVERDLVIPQSQWDHVKCKFRCEMRKAGGDWQSPVVYFRCQLVDGYASGLNKYGKSMFCYIPVGGEGNNHMIKSGKKWSAPDSDCEEEPNEQQCWRSLKSHLDKLVKKAIADVKKGSF